MRKVRRIWVAGLALAFAALPASVQAGVTTTSIIPLDTYSGGTSFVTSVTAGLTYRPDDGGYIVMLTITDQIGPGTIASAGIINVPTTALVTPGDVYPTGWGWETTQQLSGGGLPNEIYSWNAPPPDPENGLSPSDTGPWVFTFNVSNITAAQVQDLGFGIHAIAYIGCSTKLGVWDGGNTVNDADGSSEGECVSVPEPGSMALLASGAIGMAFIARRRRKGVELVDEDGNDVEV